MSRPRSIYPCRIYVIYFSFWYFIMINRIISWIQTFMFFCLFFSFFLSKAVTSNARLKFAKKLSKCLCNTFPIGTVFISIGSYIWEIWLFDLFIKILNFIDYPEIRWPHQKWHMTLGTILVFVERSFFHKHSRFIGQKGKEVYVSLTLLYQFHPLHRH